MKDTRINYALVGAFVLTMLVALGVSIALLTGRTGTMDTYFTTFPNVNGVKYGTKVTYEGFVVGQVERIIPLRSDNRTRFRLELSVKEDWQIPEDSTARISASGILSAVIVDIRGGKAEAMLPKGTEIPAGSSGNLFAVMTEVAGQFGDLSQNALKPLIGALNAQVDGLGKVLQAQAPEILANLVAITGDLAQKTPRITGDVQKMTGVMSTQVVTEANAAEIKATLANLADTSRKVNATLAALDKVVVGNRDNLDGAVKDLRYTLQTLARSIDSITYNLDGTTRNVHEFSRQIRDNPGVLIGGRKSEDGPGRR
ncbi:MAG: MCE family protein [Magnetospirillum sp.]|nr:MCE family protein [Magnetospirillum sp.]